ncbi:hypothetical protein NUW58_g2485 [Xylaria curta]|uniref:Uncharacterized protein n=1 Tax=Xylaria curta TaxID=42375 RepID=A0ACC1PGA4_9PEZI|nr:hypothetical protein NUW58_g2485 [Xylaria curta]
MTTLYQYSALPGPRHTRVIRILPSGDKRAPIVISLEIMCVDQPPRYEALSYTWGGQALDSAITCNGKTLYITENAQSAIRRLRSRFTARYIWIDAICIDQSSVREKNTQVSMMGDIYGKARRVAVWLGSGTEEIGVIMSYMRAMQRYGFFGIVSLSSRSFESKSPKPASYPFNRHASESRSSSANSTLRKDWKKRARIGMRQLLENSYWSRIWTVQEVVLSRRYVVYCGDYDPISGSDFMNRIRAGLNLLNEPWDYMASYSLYPGNPLFEVAPVMMAQKQATMPHDVVFGLRFLFPNSLGLIEVDYTRNYLDIYNEATRNLVKFTRSLDILYWACHPEKNPGLPSGVPDFSSLGITKGTKWTGQRGGGLGQLKHSDAQFSQDAMELLVRGSPITKVSGTISAEFPQLLPGTWPIESTEHFAVSSEAIFGRKPILSETTELRDGISRDFQARCYLLQTFAASLCDIWDQETIMNRLCSFLLYNFIGNPDITRLRVWINEVLLGGKRQEELTEISIRRDMHSFALLTSGQMLFLAENGLIGACRAVQDGDLIIQISGCKDPFVVRGVRPDAYELVGPSMMYNWQLESPQREPDFIPSSDFRLVQTICRPSENDVCHAETSFYGVCRGPNGKNYWIRRLSILIEIETDAYDIGGPKKSLFYAFQACDVGAASVEVDLRFVDPRPGIDMMIFGGRCRPLLLDLRWVRRWMDICKTTHGTTCERADIGSKNTLERVRFVDIKQKCVVTLEGVRLSERQYVALSYVWGGPQRLKLERRNTNELAKPGALATKILPQTIADSILLTEMLGFQHLWIDALCIVQDDDFDKKVQIEGMSQIYGFAFLTIVAASASSVEDGLPGLRSGSRSCKQQEVMVISPAKDDAGLNINSGLSLMTTLNPLLNPSEHYLERTHWNSRGWTMQERVMSRRVLVFLEEQVYWVCREATFCEESYFENEHLRFNRFHERATELTLRRPFKNFYEPDDDQVRFWKTYQSLVANYTRRTFTYPGDAFDGFLSVLQGLSTLSGNSFAWGLPRSHFEQGLLWSSFACLRRRKEHSTLPMTSMQVNVPFPSWSWMGWIGEAHVCIGDDRWDADIGEVPEILCYEHYHAPLRIERVRPNTLTYEPTMQRNRPRWKYNHNQIVTLANLASEYPFLHPTKLSTIPETQLIFFWTTHAYFTLVPPDNNVNQRCCTIVDSRGDAVGSTGTVVLEYLDNSNSSQGRHEFIVLGSRRNQFSDSMLLVLQIEWQGTIARRINWGEIGEMAWEREPHTWKLIPLG